MKKRLLWIFWILLYVLCAGLSHITKPAGNQVWAIPTMGALFFVPGVWLLIEGLRKKDAKLLKVLRWISGLAVALTVVAFVANVFSALGGDTLGIVMHEIFLFVSVPLFCLGNLYACLFVWCCIFFASGIKTTK